MEQPRRKPEILAPAGETTAFLAALAAKADAIYIGLKNFSARMEAQNFNLLEVSRLCDLAHAEGVRVYIALNTMLKTQETQQAYRLVTRLEKQTHCDGLIIQDLGLIDIIHAAGFTGTIALSTLANVSKPEGLQLAARLGCTRVILTRELSIDEIKIMGQNCPEQLELELFVHGALCYCVSGRCYWSSYLGGKSGLRGRCVQPCRRLYHTEIVTPQGKIRKLNQQGRFFSCQDLSLDVLAKTLLDVPHLNCWKIEGRKKGAHYVYHTVLAYRYLRDAPQDPDYKREAQTLLDMALGRPMTHARFLPQKARVPTDPTGTTSSGLVVGKITTNAHGCLLLPKIKLQPNDYLRIGSEEDAWHKTLRVTKLYPKGKAQQLNVHMKLPPQGAVVYLLDRRDPELVQLLRGFQAKLKQIPGRTTEAVTTELPLPKGKKAKRRQDMKILAKMPMGKDNRASAQQMLSLWLSPKTLGISRPVARRVAWWLAPVTWPDEASKLAQMVTDLWQDGCRHFVLNSPWQRNLFPEELPNSADLVAGPFCNLANPLALQVLQRLGFTAAFVSPELPQAEILKLPKYSPLPLGFVLSGYWPVGISRFGLLGLKTNIPFASPKGETFWSRQYGQNVWIYPAWPLDFTAKQEELLNAGYVFFARFIETQPATLPQTARPGLFNYLGQLL